MIADLRVLDLSQGVAGPFCAKLMADFGADVVKAEPPEGDWARTSGPFPEDRPHHEKSGRFLYLNTNKRGMVVDLRDAAGRALLHEMIAEVDVVVESCLPGTVESSAVQYAALSRINPRLVLTSVTPFGRTGPYRDYPATDLTVAAMSGLLLATGEPDREPLSGAGPRSSYVTGYMAYIATLAALRARQWTGSGQHVDISALESTVAVIECFTTLNAYTGEDWRRHGNRRTHIHPSSIFRCRDGYVQLHLLREEQWQNFCRVMEREDLLVDSRFLLNVDRVRHAQEVDAEIIPWFLARSKVDVERMCQEKRVPAVMVADPESLAVSPHLVSREFWVEATHPVAGMLKYPGAPFKLPASPWRLRSTAPCLGADAVSISADWSRERTQARNVRREAGDKARCRVRPLDGVRILDLTAAWAGPFCTRVLAYLGAEVVKVEGPDRPDIWRGAVHPKGFRERYPNHDYGRRPWNRNANFNSQNHNKRACVLDLTHPRGLELVKRLAAISDGVAENFSARVMQKLGLSYAELKSLKNDIIMLSMPGFGLTGPQKDWVAWGPTIEANAGMCNFIGYREGPPVSTGYAFNDPVAGLAGCAAFLTALAYRDSSGAGQHIDLSHQEVAVGLLGEAMLDYFMNGRTGDRIGNRHPSWAPQGCYPCSGVDRWLTLSITDERQWRALCDCLGRPDWAQDQRLATAAGRRACHDQLDEWIAAWTSARERDAAWLLLLAAGVPAGPARTSTELSRDPQLHARHFFDELDHPDCGRHPYPGLGLNLEATPGHVDWVSPPFGEHNEYVFKELLQLTEREIAELYELGISAHEPRG